MNKTRCFSLLLWLVGMLPASAQQTLKDILDAVEHHNPGLYAAFLQQDADRETHRLATRLPDPEVELEILRKTPAPSMSRTGFRVAQSFDFATLSGRRMKLAYAQNERSTAQYGLERSRLFTEAHLLYIDLVYNNAALRLLKRRQQIAQELLSLNEKRLRSGDVSRMDHNNALLTAASLNAEVTHLEAEHEALLLRLDALCGGHAPTISDTAFTSPTLNPNFEEWAEEVAERSSLLAPAKMEIEVARSQRALAHAENLPSLKVGYMSERIPSETFRGITLGVSIPLWNNRTRRRQADFQLKAAQHQAEATASQLLAQLKSLHRLALGRQRAAAELRRLCQETDNRTLLHRAFQAGEISLLDYLLELDICFNAEDKALNAEREYHKALAELQAAKW